MKFFISILFFLLIAIHGMFASIITSEYVSEVAQNNAKTTPCAIVIFGATGDLTARKLLPALYNLAKEDHLSEQTAIVGFARGPYTNETFRERMHEAIHQFSRSKPIDQEFWNLFQNKIFYNQADFEEEYGYKNLQNQLMDIDQKFSTNGNRIYYLATAPCHFATIIKKLYEHHLIVNCDSQQWFRIVIEKPFGTDLDSAINLKEEIAKYVDEDQVYIMDHYLGKEGVKNLFSLRFENSLFEPLWNNKHIDHVQITLSENIGIGSRAQFCDETGTLRDIFQNHLMQLLALIAMELPQSLDSYDIHREKIKVLNAICPFPLDEIDNYVIRGQYDAGHINGVHVPAYKQENGIPENSTTETFVAAKIFIDNDRWKGIPFYIRGGKRLPRQTTEIVITFKNPHPLSDSTPPNRLFIRIQPNPSIFLKTQSKVHIIKKNVQPAFLSFSSNHSSYEAYEKLFYDCIQGDRSLYVDVEEQFSAWRLLTPVLNYWKTHPETLQHYDAGTWGPSGSHELLQKNSHYWLLLEN